MAIYPVQVMGGCGERYEEDDVCRYMRQAYRLDLTYNSGIFSRFSRDATQAACGQLDLNVEFGRLDSQTIYVVWPDRVDRLIGLVGAGAACGRFDGEWICV